MQFLSKNLFAFVFAKRGAKVMLFLYPLQIFLEVFLIFPRFVPDFAWILQPPLPFHQGPLHHVSTASLSIAGAKVDTFLLPTKCFANFFVRNFNPASFLDSYEDTFL